jgi:hypothetical protein
LPDHGDRPKAQIRHARDQVASKVLHGLIPWACWLALTAVFGPMPFLLARWDWLVALMVLALGLALAAFLAHLHGRRVSPVGRMMAPVTIAAGAAVTAAWLLAGFSVPLALTWALGGAVVCIGWDAWLHAAGSHELSLMFGGASETAWGAAATLTAARQPRQPKPEAAPPGRRASRSRAPRTLTGRVQLPPEVGMDEAARAAERLEQGLQFPRGSVTITPQAGNSAFADFTATDPRALVTPEPFPGPSAPGTGMAVPFRYGRWQDGAECRIARLPLFHTRAMGTSGSAKTTGWSWNQLAEGVTREGYAAMVVDVSKGSQFYGCWETALHAFEKEPDGAVRLAAALHRARVMRADYLGKNHYIEWEDGCGLSFLDLYWAEAPDFLRLLPSGKRAQQQGLFTLEDWQSDVKNNRSAGIADNIDLQLSLATEIPSVADGQMSNLCLGVNTPEDSRYGLSARQRGAACRPELWGKRVPGMAYWDAPTLPDERYGVMPMRFFHFTGGARQVFDYAGLYPSVDRPLDDVTGEALAWTPPVSPTSASPVGGALPGTEGRAPAGNVRQLFAAKPDQHDAAVKAEQAVREQLAAWLKAGKTTFTSLELQKTKVHERAGRSRSWLYDVVETLRQTGEVEFMTDKPRRRWRIVPPQSQEAPGEEG